jgi:hypothetical protein
MAAWKLIALAYKARRGWQRIPPEQRQKLIANAGKHARKHGPVVAKRIGTVLQRARKAP